ncbi:MAG: protein-export chaperone SecB [Candidatus Paracaedibacteraceae bacterium]|nr:protein-export chaperone SecB [Candidatus Paracaedibacteraceae bacterium]
MSEKKTINADAENANANANENNEMKVPFGIVTQYVKDQSFENPNPVEAFLDTHETQPSISIDISANAKKVRDGLFEVSLDLTAKGFIDDKKPLFIAELTYGAIVAVDEAQVPAESMAPLLMVHFPTLLFPFARAIIADMTRNGGFPALMLNPIDFGAMYQAQQQNQTAAA